MKEKLKKIKNSRIISLIGILLFIIVCMGVGSLAAYIQHEADPTECAAGYFRAFVQQNYDKMYESLEQRDGYYINKKIFCNTMKELRKGYVIDSYEIQKPKKDNGVTSVTVLCGNNATGKNTEFIVYISEKRSGIQLIPDYYVSVENMMTENFSVTIPQGNELQLNSETITNKMADITTDQSGNKVYTIKGVLCGTYQVTAANRYYAMNDSIQLQEKDTNVDLTKTPVTANQAYTQLIQKNMSSVINQFYKAVRDRKPKGNKLLKMFETKKLQRKIGQLVEESQEIVYWPEQKNIDNYKVIDMKMSNLKYDIRYDKEKKIYKARCSYSYDYVSSTDTALYTSYVYRLSGTCKSEMTVIYELNQDKLVMKDIKIKNNNKKED